MEVIATAERDIYICKVSHNELEKFFNLYYGKFERLKVGTIVDLAKGHDFMEDTKNALNDTQKFIESNKEVINTILTGIQIMHREGEIQHEDN